MSCIVAPGDKFVQAFGTSNLYLHDTLNLYIPRYRIFAHSKFHRAIITILLGISAVLSAVDGVLFDAGFFFFPSTFLVDQKVNQPPLYSSTMEKVNVSHDARSDLQCERAP